MKKFFRYFFIIGFILSVFIGNAAAQNIETREFEASCGQVLEGEFSARRESHFYSIHLNAGDSLSVSVERTEGNVEVSLVAYDPSRRWLSDTGVNNNPQAGLEAVLTATGRYTVQVSNTNLRNFGQIAGVGASGFYRLSITCALADGTILQANPEATAEVTEMPVVEVIVPTEVPVMFPVFNFPGLEAVAFPAGIENPIVLGETSIIPVSAGFVTRLTYSATEGEARSLSLVRSMGNLSIGVAVLNRGSNEIIFIGGMPYGNNLSVEVTFPTAGNYVVVLFALETSTVTGTSGTVDVRMD